MDPIDCACLIHSNGYDWRYVDHLYNMLVRNLSRPVRFHVYTENSRAVPGHYIKHTLVDYDSKILPKSWWYKLQIFNSEYHAGPLLYLDLDTVIVRNIDWIWKLRLDNFWTIRDFKCLWKPTDQSINSSIMWWDTIKFDWIWQNVKSVGISEISGIFRGDQDYLTHIIPMKYLRFMPSNYVQSWRWQALDGGYDFKKKIWHNPGVGTNLAHDNSCLIFHGNPKPHEVSDPLIVKHWQ